jgi:hypothetical protein
MTSDYTAWPHFIIHRNLIGFSVGHAERGPIRQFIVLMFISRGLFGRFCGGVYDNATEG